jgi:regulator of cell morphogenesis and NO signaling
MSLLTTPIGELAAAQPSATRVFLRYRLDFCCGGRRTLAEACERADLNPAEIVAEIEKEANRSDSSPRWESRSPSELADHIEAHYHAGLRRDLPPLIEAARKVERVHAGKPGVPAGLADLLAELSSELESHMGKEEKILFPLLRRGARGEAVYMPVRVMEGEHDAHRDQLVKLRELTDDLRLPAHACATWTALFRGLAALEAELMQHIHLENNILFARATRGGG